MQPSGALGIWTLVVAAVAAFAAFTTPWVTAWATRRREHAAWLLQQRAQAHERFHRAAWDAYNEVVAGAVARGLIAVEFTGLDEAWDVALEKNGRAWAALRDVQVLGGKLPTFIATEFMTHWENHLTYLAPIKGAANDASLAVRETALQNLTPYLLRLPSAAQYDLGLLGRRDRWRLTAGAKSRAKLRKETGLERLVPWTDPSVGLRDHGVRTLSGTPVGAGDYRVSEAVWVDRQLQNMQLRVRLAAVLIKPPGDQPWCLGVSDQLPQAEYDAVVADVFRHVRAHARSGQAGARLNQNRGWVELSDGGKLWSWVQSP